MPTKGQSAKKHKVGLNFKTIKNSHIVGSAARTQLPSSKKEKKSTAKGEGAASPMKFVFSLARAQALYSYGGDPKGNTTPH